MEYDLLDSKTVGYKGFKIEVIDATNESITYKVIRNDTKILRIDDLNFMLVCITSGCNYLPN